MKFGAKLRDLRTKQGLTQKQVAEYLGISERAYINYEKNNVRPRKIEVYDDLAKILKCDKNYLIVDSDAKDVTQLVAGLGLVAVGTAMVPPLAAAAAIGSGALAILTTAAIKNKKNYDIESSEIREELLQYEQAQRRLKTLAMGIIIEQLSKKGVICQTVNRVESDDINCDAILKIIDQSIEEWCIDFWSDKVMEDDYEVINVSDRAQVLVGRLALTKKNEKRKISIVVDDSELFDEIKNISGNNCLQANLSVILIDTDNAIIKDEAHVAFFDASSKDDVLNLLLK